MSQCPKCGYEYPNGCDASCDYKHPMVEWIDVEVHPDKCLSIHGLDGFETYKIDEHTIGVRPIWFDVRNRLPEQYDQVLISDGKVVTTSYFQDGSFVGREIDIVVTHWMEMPEAPGDMSR